MYIEIKKLLLNHKLKEALDKLAEFASSTDNWQIKSEIENLKTTYGFMIQYASQGVKDPDRKNLYNQLCKNAFALNDKTELQHKLEANNSYLSRKYMSCKNYPMRSYSNIRLMLEEIQDEMSIASMVDEASSKDKMKDILKRHQAVTDEMFNKTWLPVLWSSEEYQEATSIADSLTISDNDKAFMASAVCLSLMHLPDPNKFRFLIYLYMNCKSPAISQRALVGIVICLHLNEEQIDLSYPNLHEELELMKDAPNFYDDLYTVILQLILSLDTEGIDKKMRDEIIPSIMKSSSMTEPIKDISEINIEDFTELNPQWKDSIEKIKDQIKELDMLRQEGADTNMCTFSQLKRYPFFYEPSHWFCIFGPEIPEIYEMYADTQNNYASFINTLENATDMCNSDKFSLCLTFKTMPSLPVDALNSGLSAQNQILKEQEGTESEKNIRRMESRHFIQDMYRFCKLWGTKNDKIDIFNENMKIWENRQIHDLLEEDEKIKPLADYLFAKGYTTAALLLYLEIIIEDPTNVEAFQKIGYGHILNENYESAIRALETANMLDSGNEWTLKNLALCYRKKGNYIKALEYLKEAEKANPDSINICNQIGQIYIMNDRYDDALKYMFKVEYLTKGRTSAQRAIAWCYFMTGRYEEAIKIYEKVIEKPDATAEDWMNMGHVYMVNNDITSGIRFYKKANELSNRKSSFYDMFSKDTEMLSSKGVSEEIIWMIPDMVAMNN